MTTTEILDVFFSRLYENDVNEKILDDIDFVIPKDNVKNFMLKVIDVPYSKYIEYIVKHKTTVKIKPCDITQCSSLSACTEEMCMVLADDENRGKSFVEIGHSEILKKYVRSDNENAWRKYGENQVKTAQQLGLSFEYYGNWYLSCFGYVFIDLNKEQKSKLLARTILRNPLYQDIISSLLDGDVYLIDKMPGLSKSTQVRRCGSIVKLLGICLNEIKRNNILISNIYVPCGKGKIMCLNNFSSTAESLRVCPDLFTNYSEPEIVPSLTFVAEADNLTDYSRDNILNYYKMLFRNIRTAKRNGKKAPHKYILLLSVIYMMGDGKLQTNKIELNQELINYFNMLWGKYEINNDTFKANILNPYWHMQNEPFWHLQACNGFTINEIECKKSNYVLKSCTYVSLDQNLYELLQDKTKRLYFIKLLEGIL